MKTMSALTGFAVVAVVTLFAVPASAQVVVHHETVVGPGAALDDVNAAIRILNKSKFKNKRVIRKALRHLKRARAVMKDGVVHTEVRTHTRREVHRKAAPPARMLPKGPLPMEYSSFDQLVNSLKRLSFGSDRLNLVKDARKRHYFTTQQVRRLMKVFGFASEKVKAAALLYPRTVDKQNFHNVYPDLKFESDREELREKVGEWDRIGLPPPRPGDVDL